MPTPAPSKGAQQLIALFLLCLIARMAYLTRKIHEPHLMAAQTPTLLSMEWLPDRFKTEYVMNAGRKAQIKVAQAEDAVYETERGVADGIREAVGKASGYLKHK